MKITGLIFFLLSAVAFLAAVFSEGAAGYGKTPAYISAVGFGSVLIYIYFFIYGIVRRDKYVISGMTISIGLLLWIIYSMIQSDINSFGMFFGGLMISFIVSVALFLFCIVRVIYVRSRA